MPKVYIVGAGPGDPELLTLKAVRVLEAADAVLYDDLVSPAVLGFAVRAERIHVGKRGFSHSESQENIHTLLKHTASIYETVVRLKGGDPAIFSRVGEEIRFLRSEAIPFEVVPGITAASAMSASMQLPLTCRGISRSILYLTGHSKDGVHLDPLKTISLREQTVIIYMGLNALPDIVQTLINAGNAPSTPIAVIEQISLTGERRLQADLASIQELCSMEGAASPALLVIGDVLREFPEEAVSNFQHSIESQTDSERQASGLFPLKAAHHA